MVDYISIERNIRSLPRTNGYLLLLQTGSITISLDRRSRVQRAPACGMLALNRPQIIEVQGQVSAFILEPSAWAELRRELDSVGLSLPGHVLFTGIDAGQRALLESLFLLSQEFRSGPEVLRRHMMYSQARSLALFICRRQQQSLDEYNIWSIADAAAYIEADCSRNFSLHYFAERCAMNTGDFTRRFKQELGYPLFEFINRVRIRQACIQLKHSERSIMDISVSLGYNSISFFNRYFRRVMGVSPSEFRNTK